MNTINVGDTYYTIESDHRTLLKLTVVKVGYDGDERLIFLASENFCDFWNGAYSVSEYNIGKFIFQSEEDDIKSVEKYKNNN